MGKFDNLNDSQVADIWRAIRELQTASPVNNTAIGRDGIEVYDGGVINISNGGLNVVGSGTFTGTLYANGTVAFTGNFTQSGPSTFTGDTTFNGDVTATGDFATNGPTHINGDTDVTGDFDVTGPMRTTSTLDVEGVTNLKNDVNVTGGGKIIAGDTTILPSGAINFGSSLTIAPAGEFGPAGIFDGLAQYTLTPGGGFYFHQFQGGVYVNGRVNAMDMILGSLPTTSAPANLYIDPATGVVKRSTA